MEKETQAQCVDDIGSGKEGEALTARTYLSLHNTHSSPAFPNFLLVSFSFHFKSGTDYEYPLVTGRSGQTNGCADRRETEK
jgi:hypothetical protein